MKLIASYYKPDLLLIPIGGNFTMGPKDATYASRELLNIPNVIPMHYGANPLAKGTSQEFLTFMKDSKLRVFVLKPGESKNF
jgi:L-ascorbate metabolism protein UlaG (beta-lactamase superfamily)